MERIEEMPEIYGIPLGMLESWLHFDEAANLSRVAEPDGRHSEWRPA